MSPAWMDAGCPPTEFGQYLVTTGNEDMQPQIEIAEYHGHWPIFTWKKVTAWMPLPKAHKRQWTPLERIESILNGISKKDSASKLDVAILSSAWKEYKESLQ